MEPPVTKCVSFESLRRILMERNMKAEQLRTEMLEKAAKTRHDLDELRGSLETLRAVKRLPRMAVLRQMSSQERINPSGWDAYVRKYIVPYERVSLPPDEDVDIDLLTNKLLNKGLELLPPPHQLCTQNFFPSGVGPDLVLGMTRPRALVWGARLPNSLIISLLWSSSTLGDVEAERRTRRRQLYHHLQGERDSLDSDSSSSGSLQSRRPDPRRRGAFGDASEQELAAAEAVWRLQYEMTQPLRHRHRARAKKRRSRREVRHETTSSARIGSRRSLASSQPTDAPAPAAARSASSGARSTSVTSRRDESAPSSVTTDRKRGSSLSSRRRTKAASEASQKPRPHTRTIPESQDSDGANDQASMSVEEKPVFKNVVSIKSEHKVPSMFTGNDADRRRATLFMKEVRAMSWLEDMVPMIHGKINMSPCDLYDMILNNLPRNDPKIARRAILEVAKIVDEFSCRDPEAMMQKMLTIMAENWLDAGVFESALLTLERSLNMPSDKLIPHLLAIYPLCPETTRDVIDAYLSRVGLVDPSSLLRRELVTWSPPGSRATSKISMCRKANHFLAQWRESWECNARLVMEELREERLQAQVRADMVRALAAHEPSVVRIDDEDITLQLADHPNEQFEKSPSAIDVLNYFVEMSEPMMPEIRQMPNKRQSSGPPVTRAYRRWRHRNKSLVCPPRANRALRGHPPPFAGLQQPTTLVTHGEQGLAPLPWPAGTVNVRLRVAGKFFFHGLGHGDEGDD